MNLIGPPGQSTFSRPITRYGPRFLGGIENCSAAEYSIVRRASVLTVELERLEVKFATAGEANADELDQYARVAANMRRLFEAVGLKRRSRDVTPSLTEYLASLPKNGDIDV